MRETNSPSVAHEGYDISPLKRAKLKILTTIIYIYIYTSGHRHVLSKRQVWMSIFHIINIAKKKIMNTGVLDFF